MNKPTRNEIQQIITECLRGSNQDNIVDAILTLKDFDEACRPAVYDRQPCYEDYEKVRQQARRKFGIE